MPSSDPVILTTGADSIVLATQLEAAWHQGRLVGLAQPQERPLLEVALGPDPSALHGLVGLGPGVVVGSGGSGGGRRWCLQPLGHLRASAEACGHWLVELGLEPASCLVLDPLPLHHVSGLLPLVRARQWGAELRWLPPALLRHPFDLAMACPLPRDRPVLLSLVPTQLRRLMGSSSGRTWLSGCDVIWVGGASLPEDLAAAARRAALPLAPCYGATETAAMVCALPPQRFLAGEEGCGNPLVGVEIRIDATTGAVEVRSDRLSPGTLAAGVLEPLPLGPEGWWRSGDGGRLMGGRLEVLGRLDGAILSGGETVFPEQLEARLLAEAGRRGLPLEAVLLLPQADPEWGERMVALVRPCRGGDDQLLLLGLGSLVDAWPPAHRPTRWQVCPELAITSAGKWQHARWLQWLIENPA
jgi:O-succinylbenzoic acid--CoA ligase